MSRRSRAALALSVGLGVVGCTALLVHNFGAQRYDEDRDCLEGAAVVDVLEGEDGGMCDATRCWVSPGGEVYVTTTACDAPLDYREGTADPADSGCGRALAAYASDGRSPCP